MKNKTLICICLLGCCLAPLAVIKPALAQGNTFPSGSYDAVLNDDNVRRALQEEKETNTDQTSVNLTPEQIQERRDRLLRLREKSRYGHLIDEEIWIRKYEDD